MAFAPCSATSFASWFQEVVGSIGLKAFYKKSAGRGLWFQLIPARQYRFSVASLSQT